MRRAVVVFPVHGSPTVRNSVGCLIITRFRPNASSLLTSGSFPLIVRVCGGPATRSTENAYRGGCTADTTTGGQAYVTCTTLRSRRPHGRRSRRRDRLLRGAGPGGRGQDIRRGRVLGHGLRHSRLPHRDRHAEAARRWHPPGALELRATRLRAGLTARL